MQRAFTGVSWESKVGYCRALRAGNLVYVSGTAPVNDDGSTHAPGDAYAQAKRCCEIALASMRELGATADHVVRTRMYVTDIARWADYGRPHAEAFGAAPPVTAMVEVKALIAKDMLIEIEVDAVLP
jgi:isochorismate pyruvate lyase